MRRWKGKTFSNDCALGQFCIKGNDDECDADTFLIVVADWDGVAVVVASDTAGDTDNHYAYGYIIKVTFESY